MDTQDTKTQTLTVAVAIRRGRALLVTTVAIVLIVGLVFTFNHGVEISRFENSQKNATERARLLDDYNSYSANVASAFGKPIEMLVAVLAQIVTLRFMAHAFTQPTASWKLGPAVLALAAGTGYLISNAFNALNVQLRPQEIHAVIYPDDLALSTQLGQNVVARTTTVAKTVSELTTRNLISNTVLRSVVLPRVILKQEICDWAQTRWERYDPPPMPTIDYGFSQRDWQSRVLQEALEPKTLRYIVNPTNSSANDDVNTTDLPMDATAAADLFLYMMAVVPQNFPWGGVGDFVDKEDLNKRYPVKNLRDRNMSVIEPSAKVSGLLPPSPLANEEKRRDWFLRTSAAAVLRQLTNATNTSKSDIAMTFSHVDISPSVAFEAVTLEVDVDPRVLATRIGRDNTTRSTQILQANAPGSNQNCGPWPALCLVSKPIYRARQLQSAMEPPQQVHAFSSCVNQSGGEELWSRGFGDYQFRCENTSASSMMILSIGKRLVADSLAQNKSDNSSDEYVEKPALITNLRKVYTITVGRLSWKLEDLSSVFNAECKDTKSKCRGLRLPLASSSLSSDGETPALYSDQQLVLSADELPTRQIVPSTQIHSLMPRSVPLVELKEPSGTTLTDSGDELLPHNIARVEWVNETVSDECDADVESILFTKLNNHVYIEHGFQVAYTAATFFLFQNAKVRDTVQLSATKATLRFDRNTQDIVVWLSVPNQNAWLTFIGCAVLVLGLLVAVLRPMLVSPKEGDPLRAITAPQAIARVMLDDGQFPSTLLHRSVVEPSETQKSRKLEDFEISAISLTHIEDRTSVLREETTSERPPRGEETERVQVV